MELLADPLAIWGINSAPQAYKPFNLLVGYPDNLHVFEYRAAPGAPKFYPVPGGVSVLPNDSLNHPGIPKVHRARELLKGIGVLSWAGTVLHLREMLADHYLPAPDRVPRPPTDVPCDEVTARAVQALCVHAETYGTVSSFIMAFDTRGVAQYLFADGPPCTTEFLDYTHLLKEE